MKKTKKKRTPTAKLIKSLSPAEKRARTKKLKYVTLKTKLEKAGLWKTYLKAKKEGQAGRGSSVTLMDKLARQGIAAVTDALADVEKLPNEIKVDAGERISIEKTYDASARVPQLITLTNRLVALDEERAKLVAQIKELL